VLKVEFTARVDGTLNHQLCGLSLIFGNLSIDPFDDFLRRQIGRDIHDPEILFRRVDLVGDNIPLPAADGGNALGFEELGCVLLQFFRLVAHLGFQACARHEDR